MKLYVVVIRDYSVVFVEFYWAKDSNHAMEQAIDDHPTSRHECVTQIPDQYVVDFFSVGDYESKEH